MQLAMANLPFNRKELMAQHAARMVQQAPQNPTGRGTINIDTKTS